MGVMLVAAYKAEHLIGIYPERQDLYFFSRFQFSGHIITTMLIQKYKNALKSSTFFSPGSKPGGAPITVHLQVVRI
jgi:hypothetical protein